MSSMTSIIKLIALSGASDESPPCYLLQIDEFRILLDCGWDEKFDLAIIRELRRHVQLIDAVLLTFPDTLHLGALPYVVGKCDLNCPIYATMPVYKMGQMFMYDLYQSRNNMEEFDLFTLDDVDAAFDKVIQLKYNETVALKGRGYGITITPLAAGHMVGGTAWKIVKDGQEDIIYAVDYNHKKERHLNGCDLGRISRPSLLITDTCNMTYQQARRRARDELLMTNILQTMRNGGNVLITVDTAGRMLELAHMLDQLWRNKDSGLLAYSLALLSNVSYNVVEFAKSQIEWMSDKLMKMFEGARNNPFHFKHVQLCHSFQELHKVSPPMVVLASTPDMECGYSRELFIQWAGNPNNSIIITNRSSPGTLARQLIDLPSDNRSITLLIKKRIPLEGTELEEYEKHKQEAKEKEQNALVELSSDSEDEDVLNVSKGKHDLLVKNQGKQPAFFKSNRKHHPMFPFKEEKTKYDDYGEIISLKYGDFNLEESTETVSESINDKTTHNTNIDITEVPSKCVSFLRTINVEAMVQYIDFEGRSDGESIQKIITTMNPRRLILLRGTEDSVKAAIAYTKRFTDTKVYAPKIGQVVDVTTESHIYQIRLTDALASALQFKKAKDCEIVWIDAMVVPKTKESTSTGKLADDNVEDMETNEQDNVDVNDGKVDDGVYNLESVAMDKATLHAPVFINELKLSDFKQILVKYNIDADLTGGILFCCGGTIAVRKIDKGKVVLEGCLSEDYYRVRELLYDQYAIL